jgi:cellulose synthase (UDP-forming)
VVYFALLPGGLNPDHSFIGILFLFAEAMCLGLFVLSATDVWRLRYKPPTGVDLEALGTVSVDVFITACGEPTEVVEKTLRAAAELEWGGGNLNFGLERSEGELILVLDADQVPIPAAIRLMAGYLRFPSVAFIQSKQTFWVPEGDPFNSQDTVFYDTVQLAFDADDSVISCGSGVIYRRRALEEIGGFVTWNLVEDLTTSYELHSRGWKSLYFPYPVSIGVAPLTIRDVYRQRSQWGLDSMRLFFWDNPLFKKGLKWQARLNHLVVGTSYIWAGFAMPIFFLIPPWTYLTGNPLIVNSELEIVISRLVYFVLYALSAEHLYRGRNPGKQFQFLAGMFPVYLWSTIKALVYPPGRRPRYQVSNIRREDRRGVLLVSLVPQLAVFAANAVLPFYAIYMVTSNPWIIAANALVSCFVLWTLWPLITESLRARAPRALPTGGISVHDCRPGALRETWSLLAG